MSNEDIIKGYQVDKGQYLEVTKDELENIALESTRTIEIDEFVPRGEIDDLYLVRPYYIVPDGKVGHDAFAVIRETIRSLDKVALARVVLTNREHVIALEARDKGLMGVLLRYPYEVREASEYFDDIQDVKITKDMLDLARHIVEQKSGHFQPDKFEDHYEAALAELLAKKAERAAHRRGEEGSAQQRRQLDGRATRHRKKPSEESKPGSARQDDAPAHQDVRQTIDDKATAHSRRHLLFDNRIRSERAAQSRQQAGGSGKAERADSLQTRRNGPRHKAMGR